MKKIKTGDPVIVISGKHKGKVSKIEKIVEKRVRLKGVNEVKKAVKGKGFVKKILPLHLSNIMYYYEKDKKPSRIGIIIDKNGKRKRALKAIKDVVID